MPSLSVLPVLPQILWQVTGVEVDMPVKAYVGIDAGILIGAGGLAWGGGRCWLWLQVYDPDRASGLLIVRWAQRMLRQATQLGEPEVFTPRDSEYASSEKLLRLLDFEFAFMEGGKEIWRWQN